MTKKNTYLILLLVLLFVLCLGAGIYFLLKPKTSQLSLYKVDKYEDLVNWCNTNTEENKLNISCNALLLEIRTIDSSNSCADVQIISKNNELKSISICEDGSVITYSNDVLNYKKLMPIGINLSYSRIDLISAFELQNISVTIMNEEYIQGIVNEDVTNLSSMDLGTTTIKNSVDFCPNTGMLPTYISSNNRDKYTEFYNKNILTKEKYIQLFSEEFGLLFLDNWNDPSINILFGCESSIRLGYTNICHSAVNEEYKGLDISTYQTFVSDWSKLTNEDSDLARLKKISLTYDGMLFAQEHESYSSPKNIGILLQLIYDSNNNQNVYCSEYQLFNKLIAQNPSISDQINKMRTIVSEHIATAAPTCLAVLDKDLYNKTGLYLKSLYSFSSKELSIYEKCNNLYSLMANE